MTATGEAPCTGAESFCSGNGPAVVGNSDDRRNASVIVVVKLLGNFPAPVHLEVRMSSIQLGEEVLDVLFRRPQGQNWVPVNEIGDLEVNELVDQNDPLPGVLGHSMV